MRAGITGHVSPVIPQAKPGVEVMSIHVERWLI